ncbi:MAG: hypothetical protein JWM76_4474 [Pseudonocardiales bacterium]|nr:hypothetical protein [Pseudonocardiales bacterium]
MVTVYDESFYDTLNDAGSTSAAIVLELVLRLLQVESAIDVGCGTGIWANTLVEQGVSDVLAIDGDYVPRDQLRIDEHRFKSVDLSQGFDLGRQFDLAVCVEVAEHLTEQRADEFVNDLCRLAPAVVFSAATPGQGGTHHVNEQWPDYWIDRFARNGYTAWDVVRPQIRYDPRVAWIYRQNVMLMLHPEHPLVPDLDERQRLQGSSAGDVSFDYVARYILERELGLRATVRHLLHLLRRRIPV